VILTIEQLSACTGARIDRAQRFRDALAFAMDAYDINTPARASAFLAEIGHESGGLRYTTELWGPTAIQLRYEGRADLGNIYAGDGEKFKGHGLLQTTGRANHARVRDRLRAKFPGLFVPDFEADPDALAFAQWAALSAADYWGEHGLNALADAGDIGDIDGISDVINRGHRTVRYGDAIGFPDRVARYEAAKAALA
jgi:putative chitinase